MHLTVFGADLFAFFLRAEVVNKDLGRQGAGPVRGASSSVLVIEPPLSGWGPTREVRRHLREAEVLCVEAQCPCEKAHTCSVLNRLSNFSPTTKSIFTVLFLSYSQQRAITPTEQLTPAIIFRRALPDKT